MEDACLNVNSLASLEGSRYADVEGGLTLGVVPRSTPGTEEYIQVNGTMLVFTAQHGFPYEVDNIGHTSQAVFPAYEALGNLSGAGEPFRSLVGDVRAILNWQLLRCLRLPDFYSKIVSLLAPEGSETQLLMYDDIVSRGVCASRLLQLGPTHAQYEDRSWFSGPPARLAFRRRALGSLGLEDPAAGDCKAVVVLRRPPQGIANPGTVRERVRRFASERGWRVEFFRADTWRKDHGRDITFRDQVAMFHDAHVGVMVHGAENINAVWMPEGAAFLLVVKCGDSGFMTTRHLQAMQFKHSRTYPVHCSIPLPPEEFPWANNQTMREQYSINENSNYLMDVENDLLPALGRAMEDAQRSGLCHARLPAMSDA